MSIVLRLAFWGDLVTFGSERVAESSHSKGCGRVITLVSISLLILFSFQLVRDYGRKGFSLEALWFGATPSLLNDALFLLAALAALVSSILWLRDNEGWRSWGIGSLLLFALGLALACWTRVRIEGLMGSVISHYRWVSICEQAAFISWVAFALAILWWERPRARRLGLVFSLVFLFLTACSTTVWAWASHTPSHGLIQPPHTLTIAEEMEPVAKTSLYLFQLFLVPVALRGAVAISKHEERAISSWFLYLTILGPPLVLIGCFGIQWMHTFLPVFYRQAGWIPLFPASLCLASAVIGIAVKAPKTEGRRVARLTTALALSLLTPLIVTIVTLTQSDWYPGYAVLFGSGRISPRLSISLFVVFMTSLAGSCTAAAIAILTRIRGFRRRSFKLQSQHDPAIYSAGFPLALSGYPLVLAPIILLTQIRAEHLWSLNIAIFLLMATALPAIFLLAGCLTAWRNIGMMAGTAAGSNEGGI